MEANKICFCGENGEFSIHMPKTQSVLYFPVANEDGIKSSVTQNFGGDCKRDHNTFVLEPVSVENLHNNRSSRNIWCKINGREFYSLTGVSAQAEADRFQNLEDETSLKAGFMWQEMTRVARRYPISASVRLFAPMGYPMEVLQAEVCNRGEDDLKLQIVAAVPLYGRSADNLRDHRHVTSLLNRIETTEYGVTCTPVLSFDERGHQKNHNTFFVLGCGEDGGRPESFFPTVEEFIGEGGTFLAPEALRDGRQGCPPGEKRSGKEAMGGLVFPEITLAPGESRSYHIMIGVTDSREVLSSVVRDFATKQMTEEAFCRTKEYWNKMVNVSFRTGDIREDNYLKWISFQPVLRRIYGCSFLPYHDYGKGGRGWRDLWQDCLSLLIMNPGQVRSMILNSFSGVRMDGSNATIIGSRPGEFVADRNHITRVWMDHAYWPFVTTGFYLDQTGDYEILDEKVPYFKDPQVRRGRSRDEEWNSVYGMKQKTLQGEIYEGSVLEHILLENLCAFYEAGSHQSMLLRGADWNDALDMASEHGESVAFTCAYIGNLKELADCLLRYSEKTGKKSVKIAAEMKLLLGHDRETYASAEKRNNILAAYLDTCTHNISGEQAEIAVVEIAADLREKAEWYAGYIRQNEWVTDEAGNGWFNGYYDNHGKRVEGVFDGNVRMMLTGQVFSIMGGVADDSQVRAICESADTYLYRKEIGGYRLNTDFKEEKLDLGRMFGFAYGEKENGAVFSHMSVMYANALYRRGFAREGYKVLRALLAQSMNSGTSKMYPGIPEYFDAEGVGKYTYLTGAASWYILTLITQIYGFRGKEGDLLLEPKLLSSQFDADGKISAAIPFQGIQFQLTYENPLKKDYGSYQIREVLLDGEQLEVQAGSFVRIPRQLVSDRQKAELQLTVKLG